MVLLVVLVVEALAFGVAKLLPGDIYYRPPSKSEFDRGIEYRQSLAPDVRRLGWVPTPAETTALGARRSPANAHYGGKPCLSLYGDSFTFGAEVSADAAWGNQLALRRRCPILNFGVIGYGSDQAALRHEITRRDTAPRTILVHMVENIVRNVNQNRTLIYGEGIELKPRFVRDGALLKVVDYPTLAAADFVAFAASPGAFLVHEFYLPGRSAASKRALRFPYLWHVPALVRYERLSTGLRNVLWGGPPWYAAFYAPQHESGALPLTIDIFDYFVRNASQRGQQASIVVLPTAREMVWYLDSGEWLQSPLVEAAAARGLPVESLGLRLLARVTLDNADDPRLCAYFCTKAGIGGGHYTALGNAVLAEVVDDYLDGQAATGRGGD